MANAQVTSRPLWQSRVFVITILPITMILILLVGGYFYVDYTTQVEVILDREKNHANLGRQLTENLVSELSQDVLILSEMVVLRELLDTGKEVAHAGLSRELQSLCRHRGSYDQVRYIDAQGLEVVRVNHNGGACHIVPPDQLQDKSQRYYFSDSLKLNRGEVFYSPLDLNIEGGQIEQPLKPVIRVGTPVFDSRGRKRGVILLNYLAEDLLKALRRIMHNPDSKPFMLNRDGYWMMASDPELEWGFLLDGVTSFAATFPETWQRMRSQDSGQHITADGVFTWETVYPLGDGAISSTGASEPFASSARQLTKDEYRWWVGTEIPKTVLKGWARQRIGEAFTVFSLLLLAAVLSSLRIARAKKQELEAIQALRTNERRLSAITGELAEGLLVLDPAGHLIMMNPEAERLLGWNEATLVGQDIHKLLHEHAREPGHDCPILLASRNRKVQRVEEDRFTRSDKHSLPVAYTAAPYQIDGIDQGIILSFQDITERIQARERLTKLAFEDPLTELYNRGEIASRLMQLFQQALRYSRPLAICLLDVDHFKRINDSHGHLVGDEVLRRLGALLRLTTRGADSAGRYGGEEFLMILAETSEDGAERMGELLRQRIEDTTIEIPTLSLSLHITVSVGVAVFAPGMQEPDQLIQLADQALYRAKEAGRNRVYVAGR